MEPPAPTEPLAMPSAPIPAVVPSKWQRLVRGSLYGLIVWALGLPLTPAFFIVAPIVMFPLTWVGHLTGVDVLSCSFFCTPTSVGMLISLGITIVLFALVNLAVGARDRWFKVSVFVLLWVGFWVLALAFPSPKTDSVVDRSHDVRPDPQNTRVTFDDGSSASILNGVGVYPQDRYSQPDTFAARYFGNVATGDMNGDGYDEIAYIVTKDPGGSGTFYYVAVLVSEEIGWTSDTPAVLLGDRIAPQTTEIRNGVLIVNYADRAPGDPFTTRPSMGVSKYLVLDQGRLVQQSAR